LLRIIAETLGRRILLAFADLDPGVAIVALDDLVGHEALVLGDHRIVVAAADQALDREEGCLPGW
jgi:hypothetical protein